MTNKACLSKVLRGTGVKALKIFVLILRFFSGTRVCRSQRHQRVCRVSRHLQQRTVQEHCGRFHVQVQPGLRTGRVGNPVCRYVPSSFGPRINIRPDAHQSETQQTKYVTSKRQVTSDFRETDVIFNSYGSHSCLSPKVAIGGRIQIPPRT